MSTEDLIYMILLFSSIPFGHLVKLAGNAALRKLLCFSGGIFICFALVGVGTIHSFLTILGNFLIIKIVGRR